MHHLAPLDIERAFFPPNSPTFAEVIARIESDPDLPPIRARDLISGLRRVAKALGRRVEEAPAVPRWLQPRIAKVNPVALGLAPKSWQNAVSDAKAALAYCGIVKTRSLRKTDLSPEWRALWETVLHSGDPTLQPALGRFVYFLSEVGAAPDEVCEAHAEAFRQGLEMLEIRRCPDRAFRAAVNGWNLAVRRIPAWPRTVLPLASRQHVVKLRDDVLPASFQRDLDAYLRARSQPNPLGDEEYFRALRPPTILHYRRLVQRFAAHVVRSGTDPSVLVDLKSLVEPARVEAGLRRMLTERENKSSGTIAQTAQVLVGIAKALRCDEALVARLGRMAKKVAVPRQRGLTAKNRDRLRPLQDTRQFQKLLDLPARVFAGTSNKVLTFSQGLERETALAVAILLHCPIRVKNLAQIHIERELQRPRNGRVYLVIPENDVKNDIPLEFEVPDHVVKLIDKHLATRPPSLCPSATPWLCPRRDGTGPVLPCVLAARLSRFVPRKVGHAMNAHLFRHLAVMTLLDAMPGAYEVAKRILGHSTTSHTISVYSGLETRTASRVFAELVQKRHSQR